MLKTEYPRLDERLYTGVLPNGLSLIVAPRQGFSKKIAYFVTNFGSIHRFFTLEGEEYTLPGGTAHYLEHKLFDMPGGRDVSREFAALGAVTNAFTSYDMTAYYFSCTENFEKCLQLLLEFVSTPYFTEESVRKEQGIIDQEIGMNDDAPDSVVFEELVRALYSGHEIRTPILGTRESIRQITHETLELAHRAFYAPGNMLLCVVGDVEPEAVETLARRVLGDEGRPAAQKRCPWTETMAASCRETEGKMEVAMPNFSLAFKCEPCGPGEPGVLEEFAADIAAEALFGESSELYLRLYEQGLIDSSFGGGYETLDGCAMLLCSGDSRDPRAVRAALLEEAERLCREGISQEDFVRMKRSALGRRIRGLDSFDSTCFRLCAYHFSYFDYFRFPQVYDRMDRNTVLSFLRRVVKEERCAISIIYPNQ